MRRRSRTNAEPAINMIPLVDVLFVIVLFLMVTTSFVTQESSLPVDLPGAATAEGEPNAPVVAVDTQGQVYWKGNPVDDTAIPSLIKSEMAGDASGTIILRADQGVPHGRVVEVMDAIRKGGARRVAIAVSQ
jgi:biopolymer transport protein ExbD